MKMKIEYKKNKDFGDFVVSQLDKENNYFEEIKQAQEPQRRKDRQRQQNELKRRFTIDRRKK